MVPAEGRSTSVGRTSPASPSCSHSMPACAVPFDQRLPLSAALLPALLVFRPSRRAPLARYCFVSGWCGPLQDGGIQDGQAPMSHMPTLGQWPPPQRQQQSLIPPGDRGQWPAGRWSKGCPTQPRVKDASTTPCGCTTTRVRVGSQVNKSLFDELRSTFRQLIDPGGYRTICRSRSAYLAMTRSLIALTAMWAPSTAPSCHPGRPLT